MSECPKCGGMELLTFTAVGLILGVTRWTVADYVARRGLRALPIGRASRKVPIFELRRWMEANLISGNGEALKRALDGRRKPGTGGRIG